MNPKQFQELNHWIKKEISLRPYGQIEVILQVRNGSVVHLKRGSTESINLDAGSTGSKNNEQSRH